MLLEVYDKNTLDRVDIIHTFTFVQYTDYFNDVGTFSVTVPISEKSLPYLMTAGNYILFEKLGDKFIMGIIKYFHSENISTPTVEIKGYLLSHILSYRCFKRTLIMNDKVFDIQRNFLSDFFMTSDDYRRRMSLFMLNSEYDHNTEEIEFCQTGSDCAETIKEMNEPYHYGFALVPAIAKYNPQTGRNQNIMAMVFEQYVPTDHTVGNSDDNDPVIFDTDLNNVENLMYEIDSTKAKTVAIVAGEESGENRKIIEVGDMELSGIERVELYVDARDLQKQQPDRLDFTTNDITSDGTKQVAFNSASVESLQNVHILNFTVDGNISGRNPHDTSVSFKLTLIPYLGGVAYPEVTLVDDTIEEDNFEYFSFDVTCSASDASVSYFDSFALYCTTSSGVQYKLGGILIVDSIPAQGNATTDEEYEEMLHQRGLEKLSENVVDYAFEATVFTQTNNSFQYGRDYKNGDYVTVINRNLGMAVKVQITGVTKSLTEKGEILDLIFGNRIL